MISVETLFNISNALFLLGTLLLIRAVIRNRKMLKGYDMMGSLLTLTAMITVTVAEGMLGMMLSVVLAIPTGTYWFLATLFSYLGYRERHPKVTVKELEDEPRARSS